MVGNIPNFTKIDILRCFLRFNRKVSRQELSKKLELGEGTIRTILQMLKSKNLLSSTKKGHFLSKNGAELLAEIKKCISLPKRFAVSNLYPEFKKIGIVMKKEDNLREVYRLRDLAVKSGSEGALILKFNNRLYAPESGFEQDYSELEKCFELDNDNILIIAFSASNRSAENGALAIAIELCEPLKKFISNFE